MMRLNNKNALVTAAANGIGRATAERFVAEGARVFAVDIDIATLEGVEGVDAYCLDVTDSKAIHELASSLPNLDILFNCAGMVAGGSVLECDEATWQRSLDLNVTSMFHTLQAFLPGMLANGGGSVINMASLASSVKGVVNRCAYGASKAAVIGLTKSVAADFMTQGIRCNAICPGTVDTPSLQGRMQAQGDYEKARQMFVSRQPMGRLGQAEEIANLALYLVSDEASFTTGAIHVVDGGWTN